MGPNVEVDRFRLIWLQTLIICLNFFFYLFFVRVAGSAVTSEEHAEAERAGIYTPDPTRGSADLEMA